MRSAAGQVVARPQRRAGAVGHPDLAEHPAEVGLDGALADAEARPICLLARPCATSRSTSISRGLISVLGAGAARASAPAATPATRGSIGTWPEAAARTAASSSAGSQSLSGSRRHRRRARPHPVAVGEEVRTTIPRPGRRRGGAGWPRRRRPRASRGPSARRPCPVRHRPDGLLAVRGLADHHRGRRGRPRTSPRCRSAPSRGRRPAAPGSRSLPDRTPRRRHAGASGCRWPGAPSHLEQAPRHRGGSASSCRPKWPSFGVGRLASASKPGAVVDHVEDDVPASGGARRAPCTAWHAWRRCAASPGRPGRPAVPGRAQAESSSWDGDDPHLQPGRPDGLGQVVEGDREPGARQARVGRCRRAGCAARGCSSGRSRRPPRSSSARRVSPCGLRRAPWRPRSRTTRPPGPAPARRAGWRRSGAARRRGVHRALEQRSRCRWARRTRETRCHTSGATRTRNSSRLLSGHPGETAPQLAGALPDLVVRRVDLEQHASP